MSQRTWESITEGQALPVLVDPISFTRIASAPGATLDWYPLHHDPEFAAAAGQPGIVLSTIQLMGLVDRTVTEWAGPATFIRRREIRLQHSVYPHDVLTCTGHVTGKSHEVVNDVERALVKIELQIANEAGITCLSAGVTIGVPMAAASR